MLDEHLRNIKLQHCWCWVNIAKCRSNVEKTLQKRVMSI